MPWHVADTVGQAFVVEIVIYLASSTAGEGAGRSSQPAQSASVVYQLRSAQLPGSQVALVTSLERRTTTFVQTCMIKNPKLADGCTGP